MNIDEVRLYAKDAGGKIRVWSIRAEYYEIIMEHGVLNGAMTSKSEYIEEGKGGRDIDEQLESRVQSRINEKIDIGYVDDLEVAKTKKRTNAMGLLKPMLAQPIDKVKDFDLYNSYAQYKFDGHRCLITRQNGVNIAYSRNGKPITSIPDIVNSIEIGEGMTIDGELYHHGTPLQTISSWIKREQDNSKKLSYHCYDLISNQPFSERLSELKSISMGDKAFVVGTHKVVDGFDLEVSLLSAIADGYEGLILRPDTVGYEDGKRSKSLIKVKSFKDDEFVVINVTPSVDGYGLLTCVMKNKKEFRVTAPGTVPQKMYVLKNKMEFIGKKVQVKYANLTKSGIPFHPVATRWRNKEKE